MTKPKAKARVRKPDGRAFMGLVTVNPLGWIDINESFSLYSKDCRKLAAWLIKAADFLESQQPRRSGR